MSRHSIQKAVLDRLPLFPARPAWKVATDYAERSPRFVEPQFYPSTFIVKLGHTDTRFHVTWLMTRIQPDTRIALLLCKVKPAAQCIHLVERAYHCVMLRLDLLHPDKIGVLLGQPIEKSFGRGRAYAVEIGTDDFEHEKSCVVEASLRQLTQANREFVAGI